MVIGNSKEQGKIARDARVRAARIKRLEMAKRANHDRASRKELLSKLLDDEYTVAILKEQGNNVVRQIRHNISKGASVETYEVVLAHLKSGKPLTLSVLNSVLCKIKGAITEEEYNRLLALEFVNVPLPLKGNDAPVRVIGPKYGTRSKDYRSKPLGGVYIFTDGVDLYVGYSINLGGRLRDYYKPSVIRKRQKGKSRRVLARLHGPNGANFKLSVCIIPKELRPTERDMERLGMRLEQHYM
jgi:hypothetical protein